MSAAPPHPPLVAVEELFRRYDGPAPLEELLAAATGGAPGVLCARAASREVDRAVLGVGRLIAARAKDLRLEAGLRTDSSATVELSERLVRYRTLGVRLADGPTRR